MFSEDESELDQAKKKRKECEKKCEVVHSSLDYHTIKVPPLVEYKSIDSYCEKKGVMRLLSSSDTAFPSLSSISSPVVFKTPQPPQPVTRLPHRDCHPYGFFSVQELSFVKALTNWTSLKVCSLGILDYKSSTKQWHLVSKEEDEICELLLDVSDDFKAKLVSQDLQQVYGVLRIHEGKPKVIVDFFRNLGSSDVLLFVESYKIMQKYVPKSIKVLQKY